MVNRESATATSGIARQYLKPSTVAAIREALHQDPALPSVALGEFLDQASFRALQRATRIGWRQTGIPDRGMYGTCAALPQQRIVRAYATMIAGASFVQEPTRRFAHREFTLLHDHERPRPGWRAFLFLDDLPAECGGQIVFVKNGENLGVFAPRRNTLLLVKQGRGVDSFVQYVNHRAGKRAVRILGC